MNYAPLAPMGDADFVAEITMQPLLTLPDCNSTDERDTGGVQRSMRVCDCALFGLMLWTLVHTGEALAGDQAPLGGDATGRDFTGARPATAMSMQPIPDPFRVTVLAGAADGAPAEFCPRKQSMLDADKRAIPVEDESIMRSTSIWQRLNDSRTRGGVQLVTLWETGGNSLSLQAGRKGDPTLQWTSRLMSHGGGPHGLLDDLFGSTASGVSGHGLHLIGHPAAEAAKPSKAAEPATGGGTPGK